MNLGNIVRWERHQSASQDIGDTTLTLESRALEVRLPFGGLVWNRPTAVVTRRRGEASRRTGISDGTSRTQVGMVTGCVATFVLMTLLRSKRNK